MTRIENKIPLWKKEGKKIERDEKIEEVADLFKTVPGAEKLKRIYIHKTPEAQEVRDKLPKFLRENEDLLSFYVGAGEVIVYLHGSMELGIGTDGKKEIDASRYYMKWYGKCGQAT